MRHKICKNCNEPNPIRCYICKGCKTPFENKSAANDENKEKTKNAKIESFFKKEYVLKQEQFISTEKLKKKEKEDISFKRFLLDIDSHKDDIVLDYIKPKLEIVDLDDVIINLSLQDIAYGYTSDFVNNNGTILVGLTYFDSSVRENILVCLTVIPHDDAFNSSNIVAASIGSGGSHRVKFLINSNLLFVYANKEITVYQYKETAIKHISTVRVYSDINDYDVIFTGDDICDIKLVAADTSYNIGLYYFKYKNEELQNQLIAIYDNQFSSKITTIRFLTDYCNISDNVIINYFGVSSRDSSLKIFSTKKTEPVFKYKTTEIWITRFVYDIHNHIIYLMVNYDEKVFGIKFNPEKEPFVKRLPGTEKATLCAMDDKCKYLYLYTTDEKLKCIDSNSVSEMFRSYKLKSKKEIEVKDYDMKNNNVEPVGLQILEMNGKTILISKTIASISIKYFD
jgi:hypothetical protein